MERKLDVSVVVALKQHKKIQSIALFCVFLNLTIRRFICCAPDISATSGEIGHGLDLMTNKYNNNQRLGIEMNARCWNGNWF
jgi:hypothetical protein